MRVEGNLAHSPAISPSPAQLPHSTCTPPTLSIRPCSACKQPSLSCLLPSAPLRASASASCSRLDSRWPSSGAAASERRKERAHWEAGEAGEEGWAREAWSSPWVDVLLLLLRG